MVDWTHWHNEPLLIGTLAAACWAYALAVGPWRFRVGPGEPLPVRHILYFAAGVVVFYLTVGSPLDQIGERFLFSAHMVQHMLIVYVVGLLLHAGLPDWLVDRLLRASALSKPARIVLHPVSAAIIYALSMSIWHAPALYDLALRIKVVHVSQHLVFLAVGMIMWWPLVSRSRIIPQASPGVQMLYVFGLGLLQFPIVGFLLFSREVLYPTYEFAPRLTALTPREDQVLGGTVMGLGGMFIALGLFARAFYLWYQQSEISHGALHATGRTTS